MKRILILLLALLLPGCALINVNTGGPPQKRIPAKPQTSRLLEQSLSKEADVANQMASQIYAIGTTPKSRESKVMLDASEKMLTYTGKPSRPVDASSDEQIADMHHEFEQQMEKQRNSEHAWESELSDLREEQAKMAEENNGLKTSLAGLKAWIWILIIGIIALCVIFPSMIPVFLRWGKAGVAAILKVLRRQFSETVKAVQKIRKDNRIPEEIKTIIDSHLNEGQSTDTKAEILKVKKECGLK